MPEEKTKRPAPIPFRPPTAKREAFKAMVEASGLSTNAYINECVFGRVRHRPAERKALGELLANAAQIKAALHQMNISGSAAHSIELERACEDLVLIRNGIMRLLGRRS